MTLNCAIIDDEPLAAQLLASYVKDIPFLMLTGTYNSALTAMADLRNKSVDLLFLDIQMPELSGLELAKLIPSRTRIVFTTAFKEYAVEGYKVSAFDYLLKPISFNDFISTANKAREWFELQRYQTGINEQRLIFVKSDYRLVRVMLDDILYIEGVKDYVRIKLANGERIMSLINMKRLEELLPYPEFMRTHRSYIAHMPKVTAVDKQRLMYGDEVVPISDNNKDEVAQFLEQHTLA
ncbi:MAG: response regulator transcription factor [Prevotella sp.]|nr:response regulator transcription factor [Prevotella sp.]